MCRLAFNTGIVYEDAKEFDAAYPYFRQAYEVAMQVFGPEHYFTEKYKSTLEEKNYARIAKKKGHTLNWSLNEDGGLSPNRHFVSP